MSKTVVGLFHDRDEAESTLEDLVQAGIPRPEISVIAKGETMQAAPDSGPLDTGAGAGAAIGGIAGLVLGLGALAIPGIGPILAAGPIVAALTGAGIGAAAGGLLGALSHMGVPEDEANFYAEAIRHGSTLISVHVVNDDQARQALKVLNRHGAIDAEEQEEAVVLPSAGDRLRRVRVYSRPPAS